MATPATAANDGCLRDDRIGDVTPAKAAPGTAVPVMPSTTSDAGVRWCGVGVGSWLPPGSHLKAGAAPPPAQEGISDMAAVERFLRDSNTVVWADA
jgi:hypothetical protein